MRLLILFLVPIVISCNQQPEYWDLSHFNFVEDALSDEEAVKVIYKNTWLDQDHSLDAYNHYVIVSQESGDTVNLLSLFVTPFTNEQMVFNYFSINSSLVKGHISAFSHSDLDSISNEDTSSLKIKERTLRFRNVLKGSYFETIANNDFPTVIGMLGKIYP
ncbi:MAG: hypothetical protein COA58_12020 [Bacteroidetes bacterium]|nr:MAG: hypothetical protein COA58_12020 [Bacteroidota bacterium]